MHSIEWWHCRWHWVIINHPHQPILYWISPRQASTEVVYRQQSRGH